MSRSTVVRTALLAAILAIFPLVLAPSPSRAAPGEFDRFDRLAEEARASSDLRLRILFNFRVVPIEALVDQARGSTDPLALSLLVNRCSGVDARRCDAVELARRWTVADTQNQVAWLTLAAVVRARGDAAEADRTVMRAAEASVWREQRMPIVRLLAQAAPVATVLTERVDLLEAALGVAAASGTPYGPDREFRHACSTSALLRACVRLIETSFRDTDDMATLSSAAPFSARAGEPGTVVDQRQRRVDALRWAAQNAPDTDQRRLRHYEAIVAHGFVKAAEQALADTGVSEREAASRWATMQLARGAR